jgi:hypothetical protein
MLSISLLHSSTVILPHNSCTPLASPPAPQFSFLRGSRDVQLGLDHVIEKAKALRVQYLDLHTNSKPNLRCVSYLHHAGSRSPQEKAPISPDFPTRQSPNGDILFGIHIPFNFTKNPRSIPSHAAPDHDFSSPKFHSFMNIPLFESSVLFFHTYCCPSEPYMLILHSSDHMTFFQSSTVQSSNF